MSTRALSRWTWCLSLAALAGLAACRAEEKNEDHEPFFAGQVAAPEREACPGGGGEAVGGALAVRLFLGEGVSPEALRAETLAAQRYFHRHGLELRAASPAPTRLELRAALGGTAREVERALAGAGVSSDEIARGSERVRKLTSRVVASPLRRLLDEHASPAKAELNVVLLERIVGRRSPIAAHLPNLAGLTLSPLLEDLTDPAAELRAALDLGRHTPTVLLARAELKNLHPTIRKTTLAHELGHALGLPHRSERENLMSLARRRDCLPILDEDQLAALREALPRLAH